MPAVFAEPFHDAALHLVGLCVLVTVLEVYGWKKQQDTKKAKEESDDPANFKPPFSLGAILPFILFNMCMRQYFSWRENPVIVTVPLSIFGDYENIFAKIISWGIKDRNGAIGYLFISLIARQTFKKLIYFVTGTSPPSMSKAGPTGGLKAMWDQAKTKLEELEDVKDDSKDK